MQKGPKKGWIRSIRHFAGCGEAFTASGFSVPFFRFHRKTTPFHRKTTPFPLQWMAGFGYTEHKSAHLLCGPFLRGAAACVQRREIMANAKLYAPKRARRLPAALLVLLVCAGVLRFGLALVTEGYSTDVA